MCALLIVAGDPGIEVGLQLLDAAVDPLAEGDLVEFLQHRLVKTFADAVGLWTPRLGSGVVDAESFRLFPCQCDNATVCHQRHPELHTLTVYSIECHP
jgi:hypothetical protein